MAATEDTLIEDARADLEAHRLDTHTLPDDEEERERYRIPDDGAAAWAQRKLAHAQARIAAIDALVVEEIRLLNEWAEQARKEHEDDAARFTGYLSEYLRTIIEPELQQHLDAGLDLEAAWAKVRTKGHPLPLGRLQARIIGGNVRIDDKALFVKWAAEGQHDELLKTEPAGVTPIKDRAQVRDGVAYIDGEAIPGVTVEPRAIKYGP